jgi:hypothetical protein
MSASLHNGFHSVAKCVENGQRIDRKRAFTCVLPIYKSMIKIIFVRQIVNVELGIARHRIFTLYVVPVATRNKSSSVRTDQPRQYVPTSPNV